MLGRILATQQIYPDDERLLVGNASRDDAAVYQISDTEALVSTTDFFLPIVDDPVEFGRIAAANALSDVYAMGGRPLLALGILGWPIAKLPPEVAQRVLEGGRIACREAGISLAGGHSIDNPEPLFGLAVSGMVKTERLKTNAMAEVGDLIFLTKPLGIGVLTTAMKRGVLDAEDQRRAIDQMLQLNSVGYDLSGVAGVHAVTDVTGFGLLGHLAEVCHASKVGAELAFDAIPILPNVRQYVETGVFPGGTRRNWASQQDALVNAAIDDSHWPILCDPQTNGGLLITVSEEGAADVALLLESRGLHCAPIGKVTAGNEGTSVVEVR